MPRITRPFALLAGAAFLALPCAAQACACGCGIFDVGDGSVIPQASDSGISVFLRYAYMDQNQNREQGHAAPAADNNDKRIATHFLTLGGSYQINPRWMVMAQLPVFDRHFTTAAAPDTGGDATHEFPLTAPGDMELNVTYTGFSHDMATGIGIGIKLPTGRSTSPTYANYLGAAPVYDRDTLPGTGSTDLMVSGYHAGHIGIGKADAAHWFVQAQYKFAVATRDDYRPGNELNAAIGISYDLNAGHTTIAPTLQLLGSVRARDSGANSDPLNSGYQRLLIAPGLRVRVTSKMSVYADVELPVAQYVNAAATGVEDSSGQLAVPALFKVQVNYGF